MCAVRGLWSGDYEMLVSELSALTEEKAIEELWGRLPGPKATRPWHQQEGEGHTSCHSGAAVNPNLQTLPLLLTPACQERGPEMVP